MTLQGLLAKLEYIAKETHIEDPEGEYPLSRSVYQLPQDLADLLVRSREGLPI